MWDDCCKGHGRIENRRHEALSAGVAELGWPGARQVMRSTRVRYLPGKVERETTYYITSVPRAVMGAEGLGKRVRTHWGIENRLHHVRDMTFAEDACRMRTAHLPQIWAAVRNAAIFALRKLGASTIPAAIRYIAGFPRTAVEIACGSSLRIDY